MNLVLHFTKCKTRKKNINDILANLWNYFFFYFQRYTAFEMIGGSLCAIWCCNEIEMRCYLEKSLTISHCHVSVGKIQRQPGSFSVVQRLSISVNWVSKKKYTFISSVQHMQQYLMTPLISAAVQGKVN